MYSYHLAPSFTVSYAFTNPWKGRVGPVLDQRSNTWNMVIGSDRTDSCKVAWPESESKEWKGCSFWGILIVTRVKVEEKFVLSQNFWAASKIKIPFWHRQLSIFLLAWTPLWPHNFHAHPHNPNPVVPTRQWLPSWPKTINYKSPSHKYQASSYYMWTKGITCSY